VPFHGLQLETGFEPGDYGLHIEAVLAGVHIDTDITSLRKGMNANVAFRKQYETTQAARFFLLLWAGYDNNGFGNVVHAKAAGQCVQEVRDQGLVSEFGSATFITIQHEMDAKLTYLDVLKTPLSTDHICRHSLSPQNCFITVLRKF
jgi:hypothetical protein